MPRKNYKSIAPNESFIFMKIKPGSRDNQGKKYTAHETMQVYIDDGAIHGSQLMSYLAECRQVK